MPKKNIKKRKHGVIYYNAPRKRKVFYFFTAFFITLAIAGFATGIAVADKNSRKLGWNEPSEVFAVTNSGQDVDVTMIGENFAIDTSSVSAFFIKVKQTTIYIEPEPLRFIEIAWSQINPLENQLMSYCARFLP